MKLKKLVIATMFATAFTANASNTEVKEEFTSKEESYAVGVKLGESIAKSLKFFDQAGVEYDIDIILEGIRAKVKETPQMNQEQMTAAINSFNEKVQKNRLKEQNKRVTENAKILEEYSKKEGVTKTKSGLMYEVLQKGNGAKPSASNTVKVHYTGYFLDGTVFDSSHKRNQPAEFAVTKVIKGWTEALQLMSVGSKFKLTIPSDLAYGVRGTRSIPANTILQFDVELLEVK